MKFPVFSQFNDETKKSVTDYLQRRMGLLEKENNDISDEIHEDRDFYQEYPDQLEYLYREYDKNNDEIVLISEIIVLLK